MKKIVLFASGSGTNVENIIRYFQNKNNFKVAKVFCNNPVAKVIERAQNLNISFQVFNKEAFLNGTVLEQLNQIQPNLIVLAGFLWQFPTHIIKEYPNKIINIHPALLPNYGGKGMYGMHVHQAVLNNKEKVTGITIHYVNEHYDEGGIIFQKEITIENCQTPQEIAAKIHSLEHHFFPQEIEKLLIHNS